MADQPVPTREGSVEADGHSIHFEYFGDGDREAVCLLNGLAMHTKAWYPFLPLLRPEFDVLLYDYLGQGQSSAPDEPVSITRLGAYLTLIMDELGVAKIHTMGISYGGFVAIEHARQFRDRLHTLTLSGIILSREELFEMYEALSLRFYALGPDQFGLYTHYLYEKIFGESFLRRVGRDALEPMRQRFEERYRASIHSLVRFTEAQEEYFGKLDERMPEYRAVTVPTLLMPGEHDRVVLPCTQRKMLDIFPNSRWLPIPDCGHTAHLEQPSEFFGNLTAFMRAKSIQF